MSELDTNTWELSERILENDVSRVRQNVNTYRGCHTETGFEYDVVDSETETVYEGLMDNMSPEEAGEAMGEIINNLEDRLYTQSKTVELHGDCFTETIDLDNAGGLTQHVAQQLTLGVYTETDQAFNESMSAKAEEAERDYRL